MNATQLKTVTIEDIESWEPCYSPMKYLPEDWTGTAIDILKVTDCPPPDRLWVVCRDELIDEKTVRLFAVWCARQALALIENPDPRSVEAVVAAEGFALGTHTAKQLSTAHTAADAAAADAAYTADAAAAAYTAAAAAADADTADAAAYAAHAARAADATAARAAAREKQCKKLLAVLEGREQW